MVRAIGAVPGARTIIERRRADLADATHDRLAANWVRARRDLDVVVAYQGSALRTLGAARHAGAKAILVGTHPLSHHRIAAREYAKFGFKESMETPPRLLAETVAADHILTASALTTQALLEQGVPEEKIKEIPYGVETRFLDRVRPPRRGDAPAKFLFVGKLSVHKGLHTLREAWSALPMPDITLTVIGRPACEVERRLLETWKDDRVRIVPEVSDVADAYLDADVFVFPSFVEGFGMVSLEAMASGLPVIVTEHSRGVVRDGVDGFVLPSGDVAALVARMAQMAASAELRRMMGTNARERAREYTWDRFGSELEHWLRTIRGAGETAHPPRQHQLSPSPR
jgi:glycosyltransferase involved in cell wall biosynthesis